MHKLVTVNIHMNNAVMIYKECKAFSDYGFIYSNTELENGVTFPKALQLFKSVLMIFYIMEVTKIFLYHYFDKTIRPFVNLSDIPMNEAKAVLNAIKESKPNVQSAKRHSEYMEDRYYYEEILRIEFVKKGGIIRRRSPHYMVVEHSPWLSTWFENSSYIKIPVEEFDLKTISFTYGDSHPTFSPRLNKMDGKEYRKKLYTYEEILIIIEKYGLPQTWNDDGKYGPERYIEAHIWCDETIDKYR